MDWSFNILSLLLLSSSGLTGYEKFNAMYKQQTKRPMNCFGFICDEFKLHVKRKRIKT